MRSELCCMVTLALLLEEPLTGAAPRGDVFSVEGSGDALSAVMPSMPTGFAAERARNAAGEPVRRSGDQRAVAFASVPEMELDPRVAPYEAQRLADLRIVAARREYEAATFGVYAFEPLDHLSATVDGLSLPCEVRRSAWYWVATDKHAKRCKPLEVALVRGPCDLDAGRAVRFWITVWVPPDAPAERHRATVVLRDSKGVVCRFPLRVTVLPITLPDPPIDYALWYGPQWAWGRGTRMPRHFQQMQDYGLTSVVMANIHPELSVAHDGRVQTAFRQVDRVADAFMAAGLRGPVVLDARWVNGWCSEYGRAMAAAGGDASKLLKIAGGYHTDPYPSAHTRRAFLSVVKAMIEHARQKGWPSVWVYAQEEATNKGVRVEQLRYFAPLLREAGATSFMVSNALWGAHDDESTFIGDLWDVRSFSFFTERVIQRGRAAKRRLAGFNLRGGARRSAGFYALRAGLKHVSYWAYQWAYPFAKDTGLLQGSVYALPGADGPVPTRRLTLLREGIDDARYVAALKPEAREAFLRSVARRFPLDTPSLGLRHEPANGERECQALRMLAARMILGKTAPKHIPAPSQPPQLEPVENLLRNGDMEIAAGTGIPAHWRPQFADLPAESHTLCADAAKTGQGGVRLKRDPDQERRHVYLIQSIPNVPALRGKTLRLTCHFRIRGGQGLVALRTRCWRRGDWIGDVCRIWAPAGQDRVMMSAWQNNRSWGRFPVSGPRGRWIKAASQGVVPQGATNIQAFFGMSAGDESRFEVDVDACRLEVMEEETLQLIPAWNLATLADGTLPLELHVPASWGKSPFAVGLTVDGDPLGTYHVDGGSCRLAVPVGSLEAGPHDAVALVTKPQGQRFSASARFLLVSVESE